MSLLDWLFTGSDLHARLVRLEVLLCTVIHQGEKIMALIDDLKKAQQDILDSLGAITGSVSNIGTDVDQLLALVTAPAPDLTEVVAMATQIQERTTAVKAALAAIDAKYPHGVMDAPAPAPFILPPRQEKAIQKAIMEYLWVKRVMIWRANTGAVTAIYRGKRRFVRFGMAGQSDIMGVLPGGKFLALEVKRPGQVVTRAQADFLKRVASLGGAAAVVTCVEDVQRVLAEEGVR